jgi:hypothetical protein
MNVQILIKCIYSKKNSDLKKVLEENKTIKAELEKLKNKLEESLEYIQNKENENNIQGKKKSQRLVILEQQKQQIINDNKQEVEVYQKQIKELKNSILHYQISIQSQKLASELTEKKEREKYENELDHLKNELQEQKLQMETLRDFNISIQSSQNRSNRCN